MTVSSVNVPSANPLPIPRRLKPAEWRKAHHKFAKHPVQPEDRERAVAEFLAQHDVTHYPTVATAPIQGELTPPPELLARHATQQELWSQGARTNDQIKWFV